MKNIKSAERSNVENHSTQLSLQLQNNYRSGSSRNTMEFHPKSHPFVFFKHSGNAKTPFASRENQGIGLKENQVATPNSPNKTWPMWKTQVFFKTYLLQPPNPKKNQEKTSKHPPAWVGQHGQSAISQFLHLAGAVVGAKSIRCSFLQCWLADL